MECCSGRVQPVGSTLPCAICRRGCRKNRKKDKRCRRAGAERPARIRRKGTEGGAARTALKVRTGRPGKPPRGPRRSCRDLRPWWVGAALAEDCPLGWEYPYEGSGRATPRSSSPKVRHVHEGFESGATGRLAR